MLLGNYHIFERHVGRMFSGEGYPSTWLHGETFQSFWFGDHVVEGSTEKSGFMPGYSAPYSYALPPTAGGMSSHNNASIRVSATAPLVAAKPISGSTTLTLSATGGVSLIAPLSGSTTITLSATGAMLSEVNCVGSATLSLSASAAMTALAQLSGSTSITLAPDGSIIGIAYLSGTSSNETEFSADALARAVWDALAADFDTPGSMGELLGNASSAGDPWGTALPGAYADGTAGKIVGSKLLKLAQFLALK